MKTGMVDGFAWFAGQLMHALVPQAGSRSKATHADTLVRESPKPTVPPRLPGLPPTAAALATPGDATRCKVEDLTLAQLDVFFANLRKSYHPRARALYDEIIAGGTNFVPPHVLRHTDADGVLRTYVVSRTLARGAFGKFRHVLELGAHQHHLAAKEFRDGSRFWRDMGKARMRLAGLDLSARETSRAGFNPQAVAELYNGGILSQAQKTAIEANCASAADLVRDGVLTPSQGRSILLNESYVRRLVQNDRLTPQEKAEVLLTRFVTPEDVACEYALAARVNSPLAAIDSLTLDGRMFVFTRVMDGELTLAKDLNAKQAAGIARHALTTVGAHMAWWHNIGIVHRDLKPNNILLDFAAQDMVPCDLGLSVTLVDGQAEGYAGTLGFMAPELLDRKPFGTAADVYSLGMTAAGLAVGYVLLPGRGSALRHATRVFADVRDACPKRADGMCDMSNIAPNELDDDTERVIRQRLQSWYVDDPELATYIFTCMLATDPKERDTMGRVATRFALRPDDVKALAARVGNDVTGELAIMEAFAEAYLDYGI